MRNRNVLVFASLIFVVSGDGEGCSSTGVVANALIDKLACTIEPPAESAMSIPDPAEQPAHSNDNRKGSHSLFA